MQPVCKGFSGYILADMKCYSYLLFDKVSAFEDLSFESLVLLGSAFYRLLLDSTYLERQ